MSSPLGRRHGAVILALLQTFPFMLSPTAHAATGVATINLSLDQLVSAPRWMYEPKVKVKGGALTELMVAAKRAQLDKDRPACLNALTKLYTQGKSLGPWLAWNQLQCAQIKEKKSPAPIVALKAAIARVDAQPSWLVSGPWVSLLKSSYVSAMLMLAEQQVKTDRHSAWKTLDRLQQIGGWLSAEERANVYRWAGELSFIEQNLLSAQGFLQRSLAEKNNPELRDKIASIRSTLLGLKSGANIGAEPNAPSPGGEPPIPANLIPKAGEDLGTSEAEREIYNRMVRSYDSQDFVAAIEDSVELIQKFPGSKRASEASDRVLDIYLGLAAKTDEKFRHVRETVVREMSKVDAGRMSRWANNAYVRGHYFDALSLAEKAYAKYAGHPDSTKILLLAGKAAIACGEYDEAIHHLTELTKRHGGTVDAAEAGFRLGLLQYRFKRYPQAAAYFERILALNSKDFEYRALYWQWRSQQKIDKEKASDYARLLQQRYPLSYYGLRAQGELNGGVIELKNNPLNIKVDLRLLESERLAWERLNVLLKAGWLKEGEKELEALPEPQSPEERLVRGKLWASVLRYDLAVQNVNKALDENPALQQTTALKIVFPYEYRTWVARESKNSGVGEDWIRSLMRQESTFRPDVKSVSNALGVMQLLPSTAEEVARDLKMKNVQFPDSLYDPEVNIKLGSIYLARMNKAFGGQMPLALAAYNAGPTRLRKWLNSRKGINPAEVGASSSPESEIWIDELPWEETSFYVKAILRNWLLYKMLNGAKVPLSEPIWVDAAPQSR